MVFAYSYKHPFALCVVLTAFYGGFEIFEKYDF
jgi:hypothetical protein